MDRASQIAYAQMLDAGIEQNNKGRLKRLYGAMYDWQHRFNAATKDNLASLLLAANQVGKTRTGCVIDATHLTGEYPDDWEGHIFDRPPLCWLLGYSGEKTRDLLQQKLFGRLKDGKFEGGLVSADLIVDYIAMTGTSGACREVRVKHKKGIAICQFWSYSQGQHALMGDVVSWYHIDEEPKDPTIYPQVLTRTLNGDGGKGGRGILTLTPENGKTELVCGFMDNPSKGQYMQTATWDMAPHLDKETKEQILSAYPPYQRDMRSKGTPLMGAGLIFEHSQDAITCPRFKIPKHFWLINGMDFGWDHPQAHIQLAIDPDSAVVYVTHAWKGSKKYAYEAWESVKGWAEGVPSAWPHDGHKHSQSSETVKEEYVEAGWNMLDDHATWPEGNNYVEPGLTMINKMFTTDKLKIFSDLYEVLEEVREYHRKSKTNVNEPTTDIVQLVKLKDDLIDSIRTALMAARFAEQGSMIDNDEEEYIEPRATTGAMGY